MYLNLTKYKKIEVRVADKTSNSLTLQLVNMSKPASVSLFIFRNGTPIAYYTTEEYVQAGNIVINHYDFTESFSILALTAVDGYSNSLMGSEYQGAFFQNISPYNLVYSTGVAQDDLRKDSAYIIQVPISGEEFSISYQSNGTSVTEIGELTV